MGNRWRFQTRCDAQGHETLECAEQYRGLPQHGLTIGVYQRTTRSGRAVLLKPESVRELHAALGEWLTQHDQDGEA